MGIHTPHIAVIGCGHWGKNLVRNFAELGALAAVSDPHTETAERFAMQYGVPALSFEDALAHDGVRGVVIAAPAPLHAELASKALGAGKHVFVEKPIALRISEAEALAEQSRAANRVLMVGHLMQYHPHYRALADMVANGAFGKITYIYSNRLSLGKIRTEENVLWSFAPHDISMILDLAGHQLPTHISAQAHAAVSANVPDSYMAQMRFASGLQAHVFVSWLHPIKEQKLVVVGDAGMAVLDDTKPWGEKLLHYPHAVTMLHGKPVAEKADAVAVEVTPSEPLKNECQHFLEAIAGAPTRTDAAEGTRVLQVLEAAEKALNATREIQVSAPHYYAHETAIIDDGCTIGNGSKIWHFSHILGGTKIGDDVVIGQNVMIGPDVTVGNRCKIQNNVSLYRGVQLADGVFCGPSCVFTNVNTPRAEIERKDDFLATPVGRGATIGANATIVCGNAIGAYALIGAGAVVTKPVKAHALMVGNPAKQTGWVSHAGEKLGEDLTCPREGRKYRIVNDALEELENGNANQHAA
jgi:UDP-2-acetamido-3-amino-2,3-dideoxy-glucuronate N-acetyltransferase